MNCSRCLHFIFDLLDLNHSPIDNSRFLHILCRAVGDGSNLWDPNIHMGWDPDYVMCFWFWLGPVSAVASIWEVNWIDGRFLSPTQMKTKQNKAKNQNKKPKQKIFLIKKCEILSAKSSNQIRKRILVFDVLWLSDYISAPVNIIVWQYESDNILAYKNLKDVLLKLLFALCILCLFPPGHFPLKGCKATHIGELVVLGLDLWRDLVFILFCR